MRILIALSFLIFGFACDTTKPKEIDPQKLIDHTISAQGANLSGKKISFDFRDRRYTLKRGNKYYSYMRSWHDDSLGFVQDILINSEEFTRFVNGDSVKLDGEWAGKYARSVNSVFYFFQIPYVLNDGGAVKKYAGEFEINEELYTGADGLRALNAAGAGTPTVAGGTLSVADREFTAARVLAGSSVPGHDTDAVIGNVIARDGNLVTVRGATLIPSDRVAHFHDDVVVEIGPETKVFRDGHRRRDLGIDAISIGQRVTIRGDAGNTVTDASAPQILFDATQGAVRMHVTRVSGIVNSAMAGQADITLHAIDRRRAEIFDFTGTGSASGVDADPLNYEIATGNMILAAFAEGKPIVAKGFPSAFGIAPPDFHGRTVIDFTGVRSKLGFGWGEEGTTAPFAGCLLYTSDAADED